MTKGKRLTFIYYRSFFDAVSSLPERFQLPLFRAICEFALDGTRPEFRGFVDADAGILRAVWAGIEPVLAANWRRYESGCRGGAPAGSRNNPNGRGGKARFVPPTVEEVATFAGENGLDATEAEAFVSYFGASNWTRKGGVAIVDWRAAYRNWLKKREQFQFDDKNRCDRIVFNNDENDFKSSI